MPRGSSPRSPRRAPRSARRRAAVPVAAPGRPRTRSAAARRRTARGDTQPARSARPTRSEELATRALRSAVGHAAQRERQADGLGRRQVRRQRPPVVLLDHADPVDVGARRARRRWRRSGRRPSTISRPADGRSRPATRRSSVDLPEPDGPRTAATSPTSTCRSRPRRAATGPPGDGWIRISPRPGDRLSHRRAPIRPSRQHRAAAARRRPRRSPSVARP